jgi:hypothetical protein
MPDSGTELWNGKAKSYQRHRFVPNILIYRYTCIAHGYEALATIAELDFGHFWRKPLKRQDFNQEFKPLNLLAEFQKWPKPS